MRKIITLLFLLILLLIITVFLVDAIQNPKREQIYPYTKAVCDEKNYCLDIEINCKGEKVTNIRFTGATVQFSETWKNPRSEETINKIC